MQQQTFEAVLNELMDGRGISNNEFARQIDVDPAQVGRWRKGRGRPRPENLVRAAAVFGVDHTWLWALAYPEGVPASDGPDNPRLAAFLAQIEAAFHSFSEQEWSIREEVGRALFAVPAMHTRGQIPHSARPVGTADNLPLAAQPAQGRANGLPEGIANSPTPVTAKRARRKPAKPETTTHGPISLCSPHVRRPIDGVIHSLAGLSRLLEPHNLGTATERVS